MLGLFLGASIFTIIDFIRYALNYTYIEFKTRYGGSARGASSESLNKIAQNTKHDSSCDLKNCKGNVNSSRRDSAASSSCLDEEQGGRTQAAHIGIIC